MDLSELTRSRAAQPLPHADSGDRQRWHGLVSEIGAAIAVALTAAAERLAAMASSGRIDRHGLAALQADIERARRVGIDSQQLVRLASGSVHQAHERLLLGDMLARLLDQRAAERHAPGIDATLPAFGVTVVADPALLFALLDTMLDWALGAARSRIDLTVDAPAWPAPVQLHCRFVHRPADAAGNAAAVRDEGQAAESIHWRLLQQTAWTLGLPLERRVDEVAGSTALTFEFLRPAEDAIEGVSAIEIGSPAGGRCREGTESLGGKKVLVVAQRREVRVEVRDALRHLGLVLDFVDSVAAAAAFCAHGAPDAVVVESPLCDERFEQMKRDAAAAAPRWVCIELMEDSDAFEMSTGGGAPARVGRRVVAQALPSALLFELSKAP